MSAPPDARQLRLLWWCGIPIALTTIANIVGTAFMPYLLSRHPLSLVAMAPVFRHLVVVAPRVDAAAFFAVTIPRHFLPDPFFFMLGREYGHMAIEWAEGNSPATGRLVRGLERLFAKVGPVALLISPDVTVSTLAGVAKVPVPMFVAFNIAGTVITTFVARWFGDAFQREIDAMIRFFEAHLVVVTCASVLLVAVVHWYSRRGAPAVAKDEGAE